MNHNLKFLRSVIHCLARFNITGDVALFIACQFALESDFGRSNLAIEFYNYCGMKLPFVRRSTALNFNVHKDKWCIYLDLADCVTDYVLCLMYHRPLAHTFDSVPEFKHFIKGWYCPEMSYLDRINSIFVQFQNLLKNEN